jgi:hypothetical protein
MSEAVPEVDATLTTYDYLETERTLLPIAGTQQPLAVTRPRRGCCSSQTREHDGLSASQGVPGVVAWVLLSAVHV